MYSNLMNFLIHYINSDYLLETSVKNAFTRRRNGFDNRNIVQSAVAVFNCLLKKIARL